MSRASGEQFAAVQATPVAAGMSAALTSTGMDRRAMTRLSPREAEVVAARAAALRAPGGATDDVVAERLGAPPDVVLWCSARMRARALAVASWVRAPDTRGLPR